MKRRVVIVLSFVFLVSVLYGPTGVFAGPLQTLEGSPIPYWMDNSTNVDIVWSSENQHIEFEDDAFTSYTIYDYHHDGSNDTWTWGDYEEGGESTSIDSGALVFECEGDANNDVDYVHENTIDGVIWDDSSSNATIRYKMDSLDADSVWLYFLPFNYVSGSADNSWYLPLDQTTDWIVVDFDINDMTVSGSPSGTDVEALLFRTQMDNNVDVDFYVDFIKINGVYYDGTSILNVSVPLTVGDTQEIVSYVNVTSLKSEIRLEPRDNYTLSNFYCFVNSSFITFPGNSVQGYDYVSISDGLARISFQLEDCNRVARIIVYDYRMIVTAIYEEYLVYGGNNWITFTGENFNGSFLMYSLEGDTRYIEEINHPTWDKTGTDDPDIQQSIFSQYIESENEALSHDVNYTARLPYLQYIRTQFLWTYDMDLNIDGTNDFMGYAMEILFDSGVRVSFSFQSYYDASGSSWTGVNTSVQVYNSAGTRVYFIQRLHEEDSFDLTVASKIMFWRTQEDHIGLMIWGDYEGENFWTGGWAYNESLDLWQGYVEGRNETLWISDFVVSDWDSSTVTLLYNMTISDSDDDLYLAFDYNYFEYQYYTTVGCVQPHFSTVYWTTPGGKTFPENDLDPDVWIQEEDKDRSLLEIVLDNVNKIVSGVGGWWGRVFSNVGQIFANVAGILGSGIAGVGSALTGAIKSAFTITIALATTTWEGALNLISPGLGTSVISGISTMVIGITRSFTMIIWFMANTVGVVVAVLDWTVFFTAKIAEFGDIIFWLLLLYPMIRFLDDGVTGAVEAVSLYGKIFARILQVFWAFGTTVLNLIGNFLPLT